jgi:hypothetical protein
MADITFIRLSPPNNNGSVRGRLTIGSKTWDTIERGARYTFVRKGEYNVKMDHKKTGKLLKCLRFDHPGARTHLIHAANNYTELDLNQAKFSR